MTVLLVAAGAVVGGPLRYLVDRWLNPRRALPWGTFVVNVVGSFGLGLLTAAGVPTAVAALLGVGFCGALTTYSTFSYETLRLLESGRTRTAATSIGANLLIGAAAVSLGWWLGGR